MVALSVGSQRVVYFLLLSFSPSLSVSLSLWIPVLLVSILLFISVDLKLDFRIGDFEDPFVVFSFVRHPNLIRL